MHLVPKALMAAAVASLAACSTPPAANQAPAPAAAAAQQTAAAAPLDEAMTGSRIRKRNADGGDRNVKTVSSRDARDAMESGPRPLDR